MNGKKRFEIDKASETLVEKQRSSRLNSFTHNNFEIKLSKTYYNKGFFNVGIKYSNFFANHNSMIEIHLGKDTNNFIRRRFC